MNKQEWKKLSLEGQVNWWNTNAPDETAQFKTDTCFRKYVGDKEYFFDFKHKKWEEASSFNTLHEWKDGKFFVCEKPISKSNVPAKKAEPAPYIPKIGEECEITCGPKSAWRKFVMGDGFGFCYHGKEWHKYNIDYFTDAEFRPIITERQQRAVEIYRMFHNGGLQAHEIMQSDKFNTYLSMWDTLVRIQRGENL